MVRRGLFLTFVVTVSFACQANRQANAVQSRADSASFVQLSARTESLSPDIDISDYTVITEHPDRDLIEASAVMEVKKRYPLAMRRKDRALFEQILARDFTFRGPSDFFTRRDYIENRTQGAVTDWSVKYENIVLQFIDQKCLLTYRNVLTGRDDSGPWTERMSWADIYVREDGAWKIGAVHLIDYQEETTDSTSPITK